MAFASSRVLRIVSKYSQEVRNPYQIDGKKMVYDPQRYGYQYSTNLVKEGLENGAKFLNRIPKYKSMHPELLDIIFFQRNALFYFVIFALIVSGIDVKNRINDDREFEFQRAKDKGFVDRYHYKQLEVEYLPNIGRNLAV